MPKVKIENTSKAPIGVYGDYAQLEYTLPARTRTITVTLADLKGLKVAEAEGHCKLTIVDADAEPEKDLGAPVPAAERVSEADVARLSDDGVRSAEGAADPAKANAVIEATVDGAGEKPAEVVAAKPPVDDWTDDDLRSYITEKADGQAPHPNTGRPTLIARAKAYGAA